MEAMGLVAILVNCALIGLSGQVQRMFPEMSATQTILLIVALEHIMLAIRFVIICAIPDIPSWVATEMAKVEFLRREAVRRLSSTPSPSEQQSATVIGMVICTVTFIIPRNLPALNFFHPRFSNHNFTQCDGSKNCSICSFHILLTYAI